MARLTVWQRRRLSAATFAVPDKRPGPGSYPIPDENHARDALARSSGKFEESRVRAAVHRKFPTIEESDG